MSKQLAEFFQRHASVFVLTGAGVSTASGIPDYRDESGDWKHQKPMEFRDFVEHPVSRQRYWARSFIGWQRFRQAQPNRAHLALTRLATLGCVSRVVTQNVDGLHQRAGNPDVIELHGSLAEVECLDCLALSTREAMQQRLLAANPELAQLSAKSLPDGDALLDRFDHRDVLIPACKSCGGVLKPRVVFFGETVPKDVVSQCYAALEKADAMLVIGSSLMVYSGFRFARAAAESGKEIAALNRGKTRADDLLAFKLESDCAAALDSVLGNLEQNQALTV